MAKRTIELLLDDLERVKGKEVEANETVKFSLDGIQYEIDLTEVHAERLRNLLAPYTGAGTRLGRGGVVSQAGKPLARGKATVDKSQNKAIREWAQARGIKVSAAGRIKQEIIDQFMAEAGRGRQATAATAQLTQPAPSPKPKPDPAPAPKPEAKSEPKPKGSPREPGQVGAEVKVVPGEAVKAAKKTAGEHAEQPTEPKGNVVTRFRSRTSKAADKVSGDQAATG